jgi:hypothetical protein
VKSALRPVPGPNSGWSSPALYTVFNVGDAAQLGSGTAVEQVALAL